jgi:hypothetical protein
VAATVDGSTYRGTDYKQLGDGIVLFTILGTSIAIPGPKLAQVWPDDETEDMPRETIVRTSCPQGQTTQPRVREFVLCEEAPFRAKLLEVRPGRTVRFQRPGNATSEERSWNDVVAIKRLEDAPDVCESSGPASLAGPPAVAPEWPPDHEQARPALLQDKSTRALRIAGLVTLPAGLVLTTLGAVLLGSVDQGGFSAQAGCSSLYLDWLCLSQRTWATVAGGALVGVGGAAAVSGIVLLSIDARHRHRAERQTRWR